MLDIFLMALFFFIGIVGVIFIRAKKREFKMAVGPSFSRDLNESELKNSIFTEHGMVESKESNTVTAQHKESRTYYETVL